MSDDARWEAVEEGSELLAEGRYDDAVRELTAAIERDADNEYAYYLLGQAYYEKQDYPRALKAYVRALEVEPSYLGAMLGAAHTLRLMGRHDQALRMARQAEARSKDDPDVLHLLGILHFQRGDNAAAEGCLSRFLETRPEIEVALEVEGMLQVIRGEIHRHPGAKNEAES
ncbi:MAG: tetratricopeptide repeat protein [Myxococcota bacterium]